MKINPVRVLNTDRVFLITYNELKNGLIFISAIDILLNRILISVVFGNIHED